VTDDGARAVRIRHMHDWPLYAPGDRGVFARTGKTAPGIRLRIMPGVPGAIWGALSLSNGRGCTIISKRILCLNALKRMETTRGSDS
jgi:hypothetical protein